MALLGLSQFKYSTDWEYDTSEDTTGSFFASVSFGRLVLKNVVNDENMTIKYRCISLSLSKGYPVGISKAAFTDPSGGYGPVVSNKYFDSMCFPCRGYILSLGGTLGVLEADNQTSGNVWNIFYFGLHPFAGLRCSGSFRATTPGAGVGGGIASFELDE
jgi:hypothetical protein